MGKKAHLLLTGHKKFLSIFLFATMLSIVLTYPFSSKLFTFYPDFGRYGDYTFTGSVFWYHQNAVKTGKIFNQKEYFNGFQLYPQPLTLAYTDHSFIPSLIFALFYWLTHNFIFSVNLLTLSTFILSFISSFYCINYFVRNSYASIIGAFVYTFNPLVFAHFPAHTGLLNRYFLPPLFLFCYLFFKSPNFKYALLFFLFFTLNSLSVVYFQIFTILFIPLLVLPFFIQQIKSKNYEYFIALGKCALIGIVFVPILLYFNIPYLEFSNKENLKRSIEENAFYSARLLDLISSTPYNLLYGNFVKSLENIREYKLNRTGFLSFEEHTLFLNILPLMLFSIALIHFYRKRHGAKRLPMITFYLLLLFISFLLLFGPYFQGINNAQGTLKLPFYYISQNFFLLKAIRVATRFEFIFYIPFSLFVAYGAFLLLSKYKKHRLIIFLALIGLIIFENINLYNFDDTSYMLSKFEKKDFRKSILFLRDKKTVHFPIFLPNIPKETMYLNFAISTGEKMMNGNNAYLPEDQTQFLVALKEGIDEKTIQKLSALGIDYIIIHKDLLTNTEEKLYLKTSFDKNAVVLEREDLRILDARRFNTQISLCNFESMSKTIEKATDNRFSNQSFFVLKLSNPSSCYLPSIYEDRYRTITFSEGLIQKVAHLRMPILISPYEEVLFAEPLQNLRVL